MLHFYQFGVRDMVARDLKSKGELLAAAPTREETSTFKGCRLQSRVIRRKGSRLLMASCDCGWNDAKIDLDEMLTMLRCHFETDILIAVSVDGAVEVLNL